MVKPVIIAIDLEGTLVSNAVSQIPRAHLMDFLNFCHGNFERVVIYSAANYEKVRETCTRLAEEGDAPSWFAHVEVYKSNTEYKDLRYIYPANFRRVLLVDDVETYVDPKQREQWIPVEQFCQPYGPDDELLRLMDEIARRLEDVSKEENREENH
jgi:hypothetical protein